MKSFTTTFVLTVLFLAFIFTFSNAQVDWVRDDPNLPMLSGGEPGAWNRHIIRPCVLYNDDSSRYEMWFSAGSSIWSNSRFRLLHSSHIGFANSEDGIIWETHPTPVLSPSTDAWDSVTVEASTVMHDDGQYKMWYTVYNQETSFGAIGYATSPDGILWTKAVSNPVLENGSDWELGNVGYCTVIKEQEVYKMWYTGANRRDDETAIGLATSVDGINWQRDLLNNPILKRGTNGHWDDDFVVQPQVILIDTTYYMWYEGYSFDYPINIGLAVSADGIKWNKYNDPLTTQTKFAGCDPVLEYSPGDWDGTHILNGSIIPDGDMFHMWYTGTNNPPETNLWRIGHASIQKDSLLEMVVSLREKYTVQFPEEYILLQNYPNPFNPHTNIEFSIPKAEFVSLKVYNMVGQEVATLVSETLQMGNYSYVWDAAELASGIYLYKLQVGDYVETKKMVLLK